MNFLNKLGKKASQTYYATKEKAVNFSEELKIKGKISDLKDQVNSKYEKIGNTIYKEYKQGKNDATDETLAMCDEIDKCKEEISKLETDILTIRKAKKCVKCEKELDLEDIFCSKCGTEQPKDE